MSNPAVNTEIYTTQPNLDGSQSLVIGTGSSLAFGNGMVLPAPPTANGTYNLVVLSGVATWTAAS